MEAHEIGKKFQQIYDKSKKFGIKGNVSQPFLMTPELTTGDINVLESYLLEKIVRNIANFILFILVLNVAFRIGLLLKGKFQGVGIDTEFLGFMVVAVLAVVMRSVPRRGWVIATAISIFPFALGLIMFIISVALFSLAGALSQATRKFYIPSSMLSQVNRYMKHIYQNKPEGWLTIGKVGRTQVIGHFFSNAALLLLPNGLFVIPNNEYYLCSTKMKKNGTTQVTRIPEYGKSRPIKINLTREGTEAWSLWREQWKVKKPFDTQKEVRNDRGRPVFESYNEETSGKIIHINAN